MKCDDVQLLLADYDEGVLPPAESERVLQHLKSCALCAREAAAQRRLSAAFRDAPAPRPGLRLPAMFDTWLEAEREVASVRARELAAPRTSWLRSLMGNGTAALAACVLFAAGLITGGRGWTQPLAPAHDEAARHELAQLRDEMATMTKAVAWTMLQQQSASDRLQTVLALNDGPARAQTLNELLGVLAYDSSSTVRQSAVGALYRYVNDATVRQAVASALPRESSPVVQLAMIDLLASMRDPLAAAALENFAVSDAPNSVVRDAASFARARM